MESLSDDKIKEINDHLLVRSFDELLEKFEPKVYCYFNANNQKVMYQLKKPEQVPDEMLTEIPLNRQNEFMGMLMTMVDTKRAEGTINVDFRFEKLTDMISPKKVMDAIKQNRKELQYTYGEYAKLDEDDPKKKDLADKLNVMFEEASANYNNVMAMLPLAIEDIKTRLLLGDGGEKKDNTPLALGILSMGEGGELKVLEAPKVENTALAAVDDQANAGLIEALNEDYEALNEENNDYVGALVARTFCPHTSTIESTVDKEKEVANYNSYLEFYRESKDAFIKTVKPLMEKLLGIWCYFEQYPHKIKGMKPSMLITNVSNDLLARSGNISRLITYLNTTNAKNDFANTVWYGVVPNVSLDQYSKMKLTRERFKGNSKTEKSGVNSMESLVRLLDIFKDYGVQCFFSYEADDSTTFSALATEGIEKYEERCVPLIGKPFSEYAIPCLPNFTIIPKDKSGVVLDSRMVISQDGERIELSKEKEDIMKLWIDGVYFVQYFYNSLGKVRERIDQTGEKETFQYDEEGNLQLYTDRDGNQIYRLYNVFGEPVYEKAADKNGESPCLTTFRYDSMGRLVQAVGNGHSYEYEYNEQGYLKEKRSSGKRLIFYEYDKAGNITCMTDPAGVKTCYSYDLLGRTSRVYNGNGLEVQYSYDCQNRIEQITYGNGIQTRYEYDRDGNLAVLETKAEEKVLFSLACQYDGNGNRVEKKGIQCLAGDEIVPIHTTYQYDIRGQLLEENHQGEPVGVVFRYGYDASGNRISKEENGRRTIYAYNGKNQVVTEESAQEKIHFTYNQQGSMISREGSSGMSRFFYNSKNQQIRTETEDGQVQENRYDAEGLRYEVRENANRIRFVYHQGELLYEKGGEESSYHLGGGIEAVWRSEKNHYYHQDEQLSTAFITNEKRQIQNYYQYDAFGNGICQEEDISNKIRYTGQQYDEVTGQYYLRARYYNPIVGRFLQEDVYQGDGLNLYAYCGNNPVRYYDPSGYSGSSHVYNTECPEATLEDNNNVIDPNKNDLKNWKGEKVTIPNGHIMSPVDPDFSEPPIVEAGPFTFKQKNNF